MVLDADFGLLQVAERLQQHWNSHAAAVGLSSSMVKVLLLMKPGDAVPMRSLATQLDYDASNFSTLVDRLEHRGIVERRADPADRRVRALALTAAGEQQRATFWRSLVEDPGPLSALRTEQLGALLQLLRAMGVHEPEPSPAHRAP
jgi:DNA-binding MarR family transcriptional regulator